MYLFSILVVGVHWFLSADAYRNYFFTIAKIDEGRTREYKCGIYEGVKTTKEYQNSFNSSRRASPVPTLRLKSSETPNTEENPYEEYQNYLHKFLYGENIESDEQTTSTPKNKLLWQKNGTDSLLHYVVGNYMRSEMFNNRSGVHLPLVEFMHRGHCSLKITRDYMQTAINAFAIFLYGTLDDIERLPADYVLRSARTISMMKIAREKLVATWDVVKDKKETHEITHLTLEMYRPLFKYVNGREIARLNLSDERILTYIGTHEGLDRHQVGVVTSKYIELNKDWSNPRYLNIMNNLLCGVPMTFMRKLPVSTYLQLSHQVFYHIRACDPLQRRFYLAMMTRTKALGKSFSWTARDVARLGLLLTEVEGTDLSAISPEAMPGITAQVMSLMPTKNLKFLTESQLKYLTPKSFNILTRKLKDYHNKLQLYGCGYQSASYLLIYIILALSVISINITNVDK